MCNCICECDILLKIKPFTKKKDSGKIFEQNKKKKKKNIRLKFFKKIKKKKKKKKTKLFKVTRKKIYFKIHQFFNLKNLNFDAIL